MKTPLANPVALEIEKLVYGGDGLARLPAPEPAAVSAADDAGDPATDPSPTKAPRRKAVFVPFTLPGERVRAVLESNAKGFARARVLHLEQPSPHRVAPGCEYFERCGGCHLQHADAAYQLEIKEAVLRETLLRTGGVNWDREIVHHASPPWGYRNRSRLRLLSGGPGQPAKLGYFAHASHQLVEISHCPISSPRINQAIALLRGLADVPPTCREVEIFTDAADDQLLLEFGFERVQEAEARFAVAAARAVPGCVSVAVVSPSEREVVWGDGFLEYAVAGERWRVSHGSFFQANRHLIAELIEVVTAGQTGTAAVDLYSGVGLFTLPLATPFAELDAVEGNPEAAADLSSNAVAHAGVRVHNMSALSYMQQRTGGINLLVCDPPRNGLGAPLVEAIRAARPDRIHLVACDPATLGRDLKLLLPGLYTVEEVHLFDLFPQTYHLETVVKLRRE
ncbi:MAG: class I SAM-dependent RNA methyltransferase [Terriglobales bacterium]